jgi:hypothetical protein
MRDAVTATVTHWMGIELCLHVRRRRSDDEAAGTMDRVVTAKRLYMRVRACVRGCSWMCKQTSLFSKE